MNTKNAFLLLALSAGITFTGCKGTGSQKELLYNNYTGTDTEGFNFLKQAYHHANYQQFAAENMGNKALAADISKVYADVAQQLTDLGTYNNVLIPSLDDVPLDKMIQEHKEALSANENAVVDSLSNAVVPAVVETDISIEKIVGSQEKLIHQFENASRNTNVSIRHYAQETLPKLEELLDKTKAAVK